MREVSSPRYALWALSFLSALLLSLGLTPALRGAGVGLGVWIERADQLSAIFSQLTALAGSIFLVELVVASARQSGARPTAGLLAALGTVQGLVLLVAVEGAVPASLSQLNLLALLLMGLIVTVTRLWQRPKAAVFPALIWFSLATRFGLSIGEESAPHGRWLALFGALSALVALTLALYQAFPPRRASLSAGHIVGITSVPDTFSRVLVGPIDPLLVDASESVPGMSLGLACLVPVTIPLALHAYRHSKSPAYALLLAASVAPLSPLILAASSIGFLLMGLERVPTKIR